MMWASEELFQELEEVPQMTMVGGFDVYRKQITFAYVDDDGSLGPVNTSATSRQCLQARDATGTNRAPGRPATMVVFLTPSTRANEIGSVLAEGV